MWWGGKVNTKHFIPLILASAFFSCDRQSVSDAATSSETIALAPRAFSATGSVLPRVDSVHIVVLNANNPAAPALYDQWREWSLHTDTIRGIAHEASLLIGISGAKVQRDGSKAIYWSGTASATFSGAQSVQAQSLPVPVFVGDTTAPLVVSRSKDTIESTDSTIRLVWHVQEDSSFQAVINGDTSTHSANDTVVWNHPWTSGKSLPVLARFRDKTGNFSQDTLTAIRRDRVATPTISVATGSYKDTIHVILSDSTSGARIQYTLDNGTTWQDYNTPVVLGSNTTLLTKAIKLGMTTSASSIATYTIVVATPTFSVASGTSWNDLLTVKFASATPGATFQYSTDGTNWLAYVDSIVLGRTTTLRAKALKVGVTTSSTSQAVYTFAISLPVITLAGGTYNNYQSTTLTQAPPATPGAQIRYTLDGSTPTSASCPVPRSTNKKIPIYLL